MANPWGDSDRYDFILDSGSRLWPVQLKSTERAQAAGTRSSPSTACMARARLIYTADQIDALVVRVAPCNVWYVLPVEVLATGETLRFYPEGEGKSARWESYREAWHLLRA